MDLSAPEDSCQQAPFLGGLWPGQIWLLVVGRVHPLVAAGPPRSAPGLGLNCASPPGRAVSCPSWGSWAGSCTPEGRLPARVPRPDDREGQAAASSMPATGPSTPEHRERCVLGLDTGELLGHSLGCQSSHACPVWATFCMQCTSFHRTVSLSPTMPLHQGLGTVLASLASGTLWQGPWKCLPRGGAQSQTWIQC